MSLFGCLWLFVELLGLGYASFLFMRLFRYLCLAIGHCVKCTCVGDEVKYPCDGDDVKCPHVGDDVKYPHVQDYLSIFCRYTTKL
jgi:hypothetical protein